MTQPASPQDYFEMLQKMTNPAGYPFQSLLFPMLDAKEVDRKINELQTVENWMKANLSLLQMSIKTLQYQKALLAPADPDARAQSPASSDEALANPALWAMQLMQQAGQQIQEAGAQMHAAAKAPLEKPKARKR